jgi:hypothetical protein
MVALKSGRGVSRRAFAASIGEPQLWQNAFSSLTAVPHLGQLIINFIRSPSRLAPPWRRPPSDEEFDNCVVLNNRG